MKTSITALIASAALAAPALAAPDALVDTAMERGNRGHLIVEVEVNGQGPFPFLVDTGAQGSVVFPVLIEELGLEADTSQRAQIQGAADRQETHFYPIDSLQLGDVVAEDFRAVSAPEGAGAAFADYTTYGIVGANILNDYSVEFDFADGRMRFFDAEAELADLIEVETHAPYRLNFAGFAVLDIMIDDVPAEAILDLGASRHVLNAAGMEALALDPAGEFEDSAEMAGINGRRHEVPVSTGHVLNFGGEGFSGTDLALANSPVFAVLGLADAPALILGVPLFEGRSLVFDRARQELLVSQPA